MIIGSAAAGGLATLVIGHLPWVADKIGGALAGKGAAVVKEQVTNWIKNRETQQQLRDAIETALRKTEDAGYPDFEQLFYQESLAMAVAAAAIVPRQLIEPDYEEILRKAVHYSANRAYALTALELFFTVFRQEWERKPAFGSVSPTYTSSLAYFEIKQLRESLELILESRAKPYFGLPIADHVEELLDEYTDLFVGRGDTLEKLDRFVTQEPRGVCILTAPPGFGKTALLANWVVSLQNGRPLAVRNNTTLFVAYHFFNQRFLDTCSPSNAKRNLLRQLFARYKPDAELPSSERDVEESLYGIVREHEERRGEVLIIVLDGLDEADEPFFTLPFPTTLPKNVFVIVSARADEGEEERPYLSAWIERAIERPLKLERLSRSAIAEWLQRVANGTLSAFATDDFIERLDEVTQGFPLYLRYLIEDLQMLVKQGKDARAVLAETPREFKKYVQKQVRSLDKLKLPKKTWMFLALLSIAKGPLRREELKAKAVLGIDSRALRILNEQWQVTRWLRIFSEKDTVLYTFAHPLLAGTFAEELGDEAEEALKRLLAYCEGWSKHKSHYALQHYAEHLQENKQTETLFSLVRDGAFLREQIERLPDDLDLPLHTVQIALRSAAEKADAGVMAEFLLLHARQLLKLTQVSPLELARGGNQSRSLTIASKMEHHILWYLLLTWEFKEKGDGANALKTLKSLQQLNVLPLSGWQSTYAAYLLSHLFEVDEDICMLLSQKFLGEDALASLCRYLVAQHRFSFARKVASRIQDKKKRAAVQLALAKAQVEIGALDYARENMTQVEWPFESIGAKDELWVKIARAYTLVAIEQAKADKLQETEQIFKTALQATDHIHSKLAKAGVLVAIAKTQTQADHRSDARTTLAAARMVIEQMELMEQGLDIELLITDRGISKEDWVKDLLEIALAQVEIGAIEEARETAHKMDDVKGQSRVLRAIVAMQAQAQSFADASTVLEQIDDTEEQILARVTIAMALISTRDEEAKKLIAEALRAARDMLPGEEQVRVFRAIAVAQAQMGDRQEAQNTLTAAYEGVQKIADKSDQVKLLSKIAKMQFQLGEKEDAQITFSTALKAVQGERAGFWQDNVLEGLIVAQAQVGFAAAPLQAAGHIEDHDRRIEMMKEVALAQAKLGKRDECRRILALACETVQEIRWGAGIDGQREWKKLAIVQAQQEFFSDAFETVQKIRDKLESAEGWLAIARVLVEKKKQDQGSVAFIEARKAAEAFPWRDHRLEVLLRIAEAQTQAGEGEEARTTIEQTLMSEEKIDEGLLRSVTLANIDIATAVAQREKGDIEPAQRILAKARQAASELEAEEQKKQLLRIITLEQVQMMDWEGALETALMNESWEQAEPLRIIVKAMAEAAVAQAEEGKGEKARETLRAAQNNVRRIDWWEQERVWALVSIAQAQTMLGMKEEAEATFTAARNSAHDVREEHGEQAEARTLVAIAAGQAEVGVFEDAYTTAQMIRYHQERGEALKAIAVKRLARAIAQIPEVSQEEEAQAAFHAALQLLQEIPEDEERVAALEEIGIALAQANRREDARKAFANALEIAKSIRGKLDGGQVIIELAMAQAQSGEFEQAIKTIQEITLFWDRQRELLLKVDGLSAIAREQARAMKNEALKTFADALRMAQEIENTQHRMWAFRRVAERQAQAGFGKQALQAAEFISTDRNFHLPVIAEALLNAGEIDHVKQLLIPCAYYLDSAYEMCVLLVRLYPGQAEAIAKAARVPS